jgi:two-component system, OmpR family, phosphate regulon sensor histidine kinase PhoR
MTGKREIPWPGMIIAAVSAVVMLIAGVSAWLALGVLAVWLASLWLTRPEPSSPDDSANPRVTNAREVMREAIEPLDLPIVLFDRERIVAANAAARGALGQHIVNQDARIALRHPEAVRLLDLPDGGSVTIRGLTGGRSLWQLTRQRIDERHWVIELNDRTTEADISRAHTDFVANASHELRTPLAAIIGYVETLAEEPGKLEPELAARFLETVLREARRMQNLVSDLMSLSQLEAEKHDVPTDELDLGQLAARVVGEFTTTIGPNRIDLTRADAALPVTGDSKQLEQLLRNLIDNALKYGDDGQAVSVEVDGRDRLAQLAVTDRGAGIAPHHLPHLTRRFYRTDPGRSRAGGGTGLGLAIVKHIVERHRGKLDIASTLGQGTTVTVRLPLVTVPADTVS